MCRDPRKLTHAALAKRLYDRLIRRRCLDRLATQYKDALTASALDFFNHCCNGRLAKADPLGGVKKMKRGCHDCGLRKVSLH